ncbi:MAG: 2-hydroxyacid dehydrogenase [Chloroflexi bacterium]|nr:2-hydroxyacid dehydrogenase [Chloroflexota bacterium]
MSEEKIVFIDVPTPESRKVIEGNLPPGFRLIFAEADTEEKAAAAVPEADYILIWSAYLGTRAVSAARKARLIQKVGEGTDRIDVATAVQMGIPVAKTAGSNSTSVAEFATLLILAAMRRLSEAHTSMLAGKWLKWELRRNSFELRGKQVGIVGLGKIGKMVANHMGGFGAPVVYYDLYRQPETEEANLGVEYRPLDELLATSDVVTLHVPLTSATRGLIGRRELALMKPTAILVNTCRAAVVDEQALADALRERKIRGAGIDVFAQEPVPANHPLLSLPNVVVSPHCAGATEDAELEGIRHAYANIVRVSEGQPLDPADLAAPA